MIVSEDIDRQKSIPFGIRNVSDWFHSLTDAEYSLMFAHEEKKTHNLIINHFVGFIFTYFHVIKLLSIELNLNESIFVRCLSLSLPPFLIVILNTIILHPINCLCVTSHIVQNWLASMPMWKCFMACISAFFSTSTI